MNGEQLREQPDEGRCAACGVELSAHEVERGAAVCAECDLHLERELAAYLGFVAVTREQ